MSSTAFATLMSSLRAPAALPVPPPLTTKAINRPLSITGSRIGTLFVFNLDVRAEDSLVIEIIKRSAEPESDAFLHWRRVEGETFGLAEFKTVSAAHRVVKVLSGVPLAGQEILCVVDKRTATLIEQWKFLRGREIQVQAQQSGTNVQLPGGLGASAAGLPSQLSHNLSNISLLGNLGAQAMANLLEIADLDVGGQVQKTKPAVTEFCRLAGIRLQTDRGGLVVQVTDKKELALIRKERERIQEALVAQAEAQSSLEATKKMIQDLAKQIRQAEAQLESNDRELERREKEFVPTKSRLHGGLSLYEICSLIPKDVIFSEAVDWDWFVSGANRGGLAASFMPWLRARVNDIMGGECRELCDYICKRVFGSHVDPEELVLDLQSFMDDEAKGLVEEIWKILVFETLRRRHCPVVADELD